MLDKIIQSRRSMKKFKSKKPDWRVILDCVDSMKYAPMAGGNFSLKFILVDDKEVIQKLSEFSEQDFFSKVSYVVVVFSDGNRTENLYRDRAGRYLRQQAGAAMQNFLLKISEAGLATCWVGHFYDDKIKRLLKIPDKFELEALFPIGYANEKPKSRLKKSLDNFIYFNEYGKKKMSSENKLNV